MERVTLRGLLLTFALGAGISFLLEILWMFLGFVFFTAKESEVPWYYPGAMLITVTLMVSLGGLVVTGLAAVIQHIQANE